MRGRMGSVFSFLTILPVGGNGLDTAARNMHLFPLVGIALGILVGGMGFGLSLFLDPLVVGLLVAAAITILTGMHHIDGLADFADGLMARGAREKRLAAMKDSHTGSAGTASIVLYVAGLIVALSREDGYGLFLAIFFGEIAAKFSMVLMAGVSRSAAAGSNSQFVDMMKDRRKLFFAGAITAVPMVALGGTSGAIAFGAGIIITAVLAAVASRSFGGVTGDILGAANELTRLGAILVFVSI